MKTFLILSILVQCTLLINAARIYVHMMPWFESKETNGGTWGIHWTMANRNPDNIVNGHQDIASYYHPLIGAYASSDPDTIDWQMGQMKASGISGAFIDWPGTLQYADYPKNVQNAEAIIAGIKRAGLEFAVVYEDNNLNLGGVGDQVGQGAADMGYLQNNYFNDPSYVHVDGAPLLMDFGPQALNGEQWDQAFAPVDPKPAFITLWNQDRTGGNFKKGEYCWIYADYLDGLNQWYNNVQQPIKMGCAYPGFNSFYQDGGWGGPGFVINVGPETLQQTLDLATANTDIIQVATWNDYGEGTIVEPTDEFQYQFLEILQRGTGVQYTPEDFREVTNIYRLRKQHANNATMLTELAQRQHELVHRFD